MTPEEIQTALTASKCLQCQSSEILLAMQVYLLWSAQNPDTELTPALVQDLISASTCLTNCMGPKQLLAATVELQFQALNA